MTDTEKISELKNLVDVLCDNISDQPAGCDACWLWEDGVCGKEALYEKMQAENESNESKMLVCTACGLDVHSDYEKCPRCGTKIKSEE